MEYPYLSTARIRELYRDVDAGIRKRWGQNFLIDPNYLRKIGELFTPGEKEESPLRVFEVGPGLGALTRILLDAGFQVDSLEIDPFLCDLLERDLGPHERFRLHRGDIRDVLASAFRGEKNDAILALENSRIVGGNLPYYISTDIVTGLVRIGNWNRAVFLLQDEFARRVSDTETPSSITVYLANFALWKTGFSVPAGAFYPVPGVDSRMLLGERRLDGPEVDGELLQKILRISFRSRRKKIENSWKTGQTEGLDLDRLRVAAEKAGQSLSVRAEEIPVEGFFHLVQKYTEES